MSSFGNRTRRVAAGGAVAAVGAALTATGAAGTASADELIGRGYHWSEQHQETTVPMDDPWVFRGPTDYHVSTQPACWMYPNHQDLVAEVMVTVPDRFEPFPFDTDRLFFPVRNTVTVDWTDTATGQTGRTVAHGDPVNVLAGIRGAGPIAMDIHVRADHPWLYDLGSTDLPVGHATGDTHTVVDLTGKSCPP